MIPGKMVRIWFGAARPSLWIMLCIGFLGLSGCGNETAKWRHAQARNLYAEGDLSGAIELMELAFKQSPDNVDIQLDLAMFYAEDGKCELGTGICRKYLEKYENDIRGLDTCSRCKMCSGKFKAALRYYKKSISGHVSRSTGELNNLAYYRGLAGVELDQAAQDIQKAIQEIELRRGWGVGPKLSRVLSLQVRTLIAAGLISRHIEGREEALGFLDPKIERYNSRLQLRELFLRDRITLEARAEGPFSKSVEDELLDIRAEIELLKTSIAAMAATRALICEDLKMTEQADSDRMLVQSLGFDFQRLVDDLPADFNCLDSLDLAATYLDTRGFILGRLEWEGDQPDGNSIEPASQSALNEYSSSKFKSSYEESLEDLDLAVLAASFNQSAMNSPLFNTPDLSPEIVKKFKAQNVKTAAVLLHHRSEVHLRAGHKDKAAKDLEQIEALGFKDSTLY